MQRVRIREEQVQRLSLFCRFLKAKESEAHGENAEVDDGYTLRRLQFNICDTRGRDQDSPGNAGVAHKHLC